MRVETGVAGGQRNGASRLEVAIRLGGRPMWLLGALLVLGCGRKATVEDCEQIVKRVAELELANVVPQSDLGTEVQQAQNSFRERALSDCVGRRITEKSLKCVAAAKTAAAVIDDCF